MPKLVRKKSRVNKRVHPTCSRSQIKNPKSGRCVSRKGDIGKALLAKLRKKPVVKKIRKKSEKRSTMAPRDKIPQFENIKENLCKITDWKKSKKIGAGVYGQVYIACQTKGGCNYVLKVQNDDREFRNEVRLLKKLEGTGLSPKIYDAWTCKKKGYIILEKLDETLKGSKLPKKEIYKQITKLLKALHRKKITFMDLHWGNAMVKNGRLYMIDFGLSKDWTGIPAKKKEYIEGFSDLFGKYTFADAKYFDLLTADEQFNPNEREADRAHEIRNSWEKTGKR
jgi:predicted Ser/Thr protein kinase